LSVDVLVEKNGKTLGQIILLNKNPKNVCIHLAESIPQNLLFTGKGMSV